MVRSYFIPYATPSFSPLVQIHPFRFKKIITVGSELEPGRGLIEKVSTRVYSTSFKTQQTPQISRRRVIKRRRRLLPRRKRWQRKRARRRRHRTRRSSVHDVALHRRRVQRLAPPENRHLLRTQSVAPPHLRIIRTRSLRDRTTV